MRVMKKTMKKRVLILAVAVALFVAAPASAALWWNPGDPGSTHQEWTFDDADNPAAPEVDQNPFGTASATISSGPYDPDPEWYADWLGRQGVWQGEEMNIWVGIPNRRLEEPYKEIWVEVIYDGTITAAEVSPYFPTQPAVVSITSLGSTITNINDDWKKIVMGWRVEPNPYSEAICMDFTGGVDSLTVDTICIPEPATICLLGLGCLLLRRRRTL